MSEKSDTPVRQPKYKKYGVGIIILVMMMAVMIFFDQEKQYREETPPIPSVMVGEQKLPVIQGSYTWNNGSIEKDKQELLSSLEYGRVEYREKMSIEFPDGKEPLYYELGGFGNENPYGSRTYFLLRMTMDEAYFLNETNVITYSLKAFWKDGKRSEYVIPIQMRGTPREKEYLAQEKGHQSLVVVNEDEHHLREIGQEWIDGPSFYTQSHIFNLETVKNNYPELNVEKEPTYLLFDSEKETFRTDSLDQLKKHFNENVTEEIIEGRVTGVDSESGYIKFEDMVLYTGDPTIKVGQQIRVALQSYDKGFPSNYGIKKIEILQEADSTIHEKKWLSSSEDTFSLLVYGDSDFLKPFHSPNQDDFQQVENIKLKEVEKEDAAIFVYDTRELLYQATDYDDLLRFLFTRLSEK